MLVPPHLVDLSKYPESENGLNVMEIHTPGDGYVWEGFDSGTSVRNHVTAIEGLRQRPRRKCPELADAFQTKTKGSP